MKALLYLLLIVMSTGVFPLNVTLNTQLDKKLDGLKKQGKQANDAFEFNVLRKLEITGAKTIDKETIKNEISVFIGDRLDPFTIKRNIKRIESLGYFHKVSFKLRDFEGGKRWTIKVKENPVIKHIVVTGNSEILNKELKSAILSKVGTVFNYATVRKDKEAIEAIYADQGYLFAKVSKLELPTYKNNTLTYIIEESQFNEIGVSGNTKTKDYVILRELDIEKGDVVCEKAIRKNLQRVFNLNYFSEVLPDIQPSNSTKNVYDLLINVKEKSTDSINFGGGWGQRSGGFLYTDLNMNNFLGTGQLIALRGQWGGRMQTYQFKYHNPWMFGPRKSFTFRAWNTQGSFGYNNMLSSGYRPEKRYGVDTSIGIPHSYEVRSIHKAKYESVYVDSTSSSAATNYSIQSYTYSLVYDTRDIMFNPLNGAYYIGSVENGFGFRSNSLIFTKYDLSFSNFFQTFEKQTIATRVLVGKINGNIEETEYYYVGGPNTVRGYEEYPDSFGYGKAQLIGNIEYRFLLSDIFQFLLFIDAGWGSSLGSDFTKGKVGKGFGFRINSPLGPIRIDFGTNDEGDMRTHFNIGHIF
jgi:outer membrane protein insertion porin family